MINIINRLYNLFKHPEEHISAKSAYNLFRFGGEDSTAEVIANNRIQKIDDYIRWKARDRKSTAVVIDLISGEDDVNQLISEHFAKLGYRLMENKYPDIKDYKYLIISWAKGGTIEEKKED